MLENSQFLLIIWQNNKQKIDYFLKYQTLDDNKKITGYYFP